MDRVIIRTKLQAVIVRRMLDEHIIEPPIHLIILFNRDEHSFSTGLKEQCQQISSYVSKTTILARPRASFLRLLLFFLTLVTRSRIRGERIFCANINWYPIALALRLIPRARIFTFDDGSANVQRRNSSFLSQQPSQSKGLYGWVARMLFPRGPSFFTRGRIINHWTIYREMPNIVDASKLFYLDIRWRELINPRDIPALPVDVSKIYLGTIYEMNGRNGRYSTPKEIINHAIEWSDLYIPHPRDESAIKAIDIIANYPAEAIIDHYAHLQSVVVAHHNSSAALSFSSNPQVKLIDLSVMDLPKET